MARSHARTLAFASRRILITRVGRSTATFLGASRQDPFDRNAQRRGVARGSRTRNRGRLSCGASSWGTGSAGLGHPVEASPQARRRTAEGRILTASSPRRNRHDENQGIPDGARQLGDAPGSEPQRSNVNECECGLSPAVELVTFTRPLFCCRVVSCAFVRVTTCECPASVVLT